MQYNYNNCKLSSTRKGDWLVMPEQDNYLSFSLEERTEAEYIRPKQSANTLFRFFRDPDRVFESIEKSALIPGYYEENVDYLDIEQHVIAYPMICFCDITMHRLEEHMSSYGCYGLGFSKQWGIEKGIQPIQYVNKNSALCKDFSVAFNAAMKNGGDNLSDNYLLSHMKYLKPIEGTMPQYIDGTKKVTGKNFTDECEWRYVPDVSPIELPQAVTESEIACLDRLNSTMKENECCWLKFSYSEIKYIILPSQEDFIRLCGVVDKVVFDEGIKRFLLSKTIIWKDSKEDF